MKAVTAVLVVLMLSGCATIQHPNSPEAQYTSLAVCQAQHPELPAGCEKTMHKEATKEAIGVGAAILVVLGYLGLVAYVIAGGR